MQGRKGWGSWRSCQLESKRGDGCARVRVSVCAGGLRSWGEPGRMEAAAAERAPEGAPDQGVGELGSSECPLPSSSTSPVLRSVPPLTLGSL